MADPTKSDPTIHLNGNVFSREHPVIWLMMQPILAAGMNGIIIAALGFFVWNVVTVQVPTIQRSGHEQAEKRRTDFMKEVSDSRKDYLAALKEERAETKERDREIRMQIDKLIVAIDRINSK